MRKTKSVVCISLKNRAPQYFMKIFKKKINTACNRCNKAIKIKIEMQKLLTVFVNFTSQARIAYNNYNI